MVKKANPTAPPLQLYPNLKEETDQLSPHSVAQNVVQNNADNDIGKTFRLKRISDIREFLEKELETRGRYRRRYKSIYNTAIYLNAGAGLTSIASSVAAATTAATGIGIIASIPLGFTAVAAGIVSVVSAGFSKIVLKKVEKHEQIKLTAAAKLSSVNGLVSKALQDGHINNEEYQIILQEMENYRVHKSQIKNRITAEVRELTVDRESEIQEEYLKKGILQGQKIAMSNLQNILKNTAD